MIENTTKFQTIISLKNMIIHFFPSLTCLSWPSIDNIDRIYEYMYIMSAHTVNKTYRCILVDFRTYLCTCSTETSGLPLLLMGLLLYFMGWGRGGWFYPHPMPGNFFCMVKYRQIRKFRTDSDIYSFESRRIFTCLDVNKSLEEIKLPL